jgi:hypothetical protein
VASDAADDDPEALTHHLMVLEVVDMEPLTEPREPPTGGFLDKMGVPAVIQHLDRRPGMDAEEAQPGHDAGKVIQHSVEPVRFDVFEDINAADHISLNGRPVLGEGWVIGVVCQVQPCAL